MWDITPHNTAAHPACDSGTVSEVYLEIWWRPPTGRLLPHSVAKRLPTRPSKRQRSLAILNGESRDEMENLSNNILAARKIDVFYFHFSSSPRTLEEVQIQSPPWNISMQ